jgi:hypothetical protein
MPKRLMQIGRLYFGFRVKPQALVEGSLVGPRLDDPGVKLRGILTPTGFSIVGLLDHGPIGDGALVGRVAITV